jgi:hypothetical protein
MSLADRFLPIPYCIVQIVGTSSPTKIVELVIARAIVGMAAFVPWRARSSERFKNEGVNLSGVAPTENNRQMPGD